MDTEYGFDFNNESPNVHFRVLDVKEHRRELVINMTTDYGDIRFPVRLDEDKARHIGKDLVLKPVAGTDVWWEHEGGYYHESWLERM